MAQPHGTPETHYQISEDSGRDRDGDGYTAHQSLDVLINCEDLTVNAKILQYAAYAGDDL